MERSIEIPFFRKYDALFKGFSVPEWALSHKREGYDYDFYARSIWNKAIFEAKYEQTPAPSRNERLGPNIIQWFRFEDYSSGYGSRYFYNEKPKPTFYRYKGRMDQEDKDALWSFKDADQEIDPRRIFGVDPETPEGKQKLEKIFDTWNRAMPEMFTARLEVYDIGMKENIS